MFKLIFPIVFIVLIINCQSPTENSINQFSSNEDRLLVKTQRIMGTEPFEFGAMPISFKDTTALFDFPIKYPNGLSKIKGFRLSVDLKNPMDFIDIINGKMDAKDVIIVDQNNNEDFTDDEILEIQPIDWNSSENSIPVEFQILNKSDTLRNSSWIRVGTDNDVFLYAKDEHLEAKIFIDEEMYRIGVFDQEARVSFNYGAKPIIALLSDSNKDDNLKASESFKIGEYIN